MTTESSPRILGVRTVGIPVADQARALDFYTSTLGFESRLDVPMGPTGRWIEVAPPGAATSIALVAGGDGAGVDTGIRLAAADAAASHAALRLAGVDVDAEILAVPVPMFAFRDPDGNRLVLVQDPTPR